MAVGLSSVAIPIAVAIWRPELSSYRGLSGVDSALLGLALAEFIRQAIQRGDRRLLTVGLLVGIGFASKLVFEFVSGGALFVSGGEAVFVNVPLAHLVGFLCGAVVGSGRAILAVREVMRVDSRYAPPFAHRRRQLGASRPQC